MTVHDIVKRVLNTQAIKYVRTDIDEQYEYHLDLHKSRLATTLLSRQTNILVDLHTCTCIGSAYYLLKRGHFARLKSRSNVNARRFELEID